MRSLVLDIGLGCGVVVVVVDVDDGEGVAKAVDKFGQQIRLYLWFFLFAVDVFVGMLIVLVLLW